MATKPGSQSIRFWNRIAASYAKKPIADESTYQKKLEITQGYLRPNMNVLEFGCGTGSTALIHAPHVQQITGIDASSKMIEIARNKMTDQGNKNVIFKQFSIDEYEIKGQLFDAILGLSILHLLDNKEDVIAKVYDMLKPGGIFVSSTPCVADTMPSFKYFGPIGAFFGLIPFVKVFGLSDLEHALVNRGFIIDHQWQPNKKTGVFIVAKKPEA